MNGRLRIWHHIYNLEPAMRGAILKRIRVAVISMASCLVLACPAFGQVHDRYESGCPDLQNATPPDLLQYLNGVTPNEKNAWCVTWAIHQIGEKHYELAITALVKLLDFRRPPTPQEKMGFYDRPQITEEVFPAAEALEAIGSKALPELLRAIQEDSVSATARENAVSVWMEAHKHERPKGIGLLKQEEMKTNDTATKQKLNWATQKALRYCGPSEEANCKAAAKTGQF